MCSWVTESWMGSWESHSVLHGNQYSLQCQYLLTRINLASPKHQAIKLVLSMKNQMHLSKHKVLKSTGFLDSYFWDCYTITVSSLASQLGFSVFSLKILRTFLFCFVFIVFCSCKMEERKHLLCLLTVDHFLPLFPTQLITDFLLSMTLGWSVVSMKVRS